MSSTTNKALVRSFIESWNRGDLQSMTQFWSPDMVHYSRGESMSTEAVEQAMAGIMQAFPDMKLEIEDMLAEGNRVASLLKLSATHSGEYMGVSPTGRHVSCSFMGIVEVADGKVVAHWGVADGLHLLQQLGLIPDDYLAATA